MPAYRSGASRMPRTRTLLHNADRSIATTLPQYRSGSEPKCAFRAARPSLQIRERVCPRRALAGFARRTPAEPESTGVQISSPPRIQGCSSPEFPAAQRYEFQVLAETHSSFLAQHHAIGVPSPDISRTLPPEPFTTSTTSGVVIAVPCQLFPAISGSNPSSRAKDRLSPDKCIDQRASMHPQARVPFQFIVGLSIPLN